MAAKFLQWKPESLPAFRAFRAFRAPEAPYAETNREYWGRRAQGAER